MYEHVKSQKLKKIVMKKYLFREKIKLISVVYYKFVGKTFISKGSVVRSHIRNNTDDDSACLLSQ